MTNYNNPYDHRAVSANQGADPGAPEGYETVETAPGQYETRKVVDQKVDTAAAEMMNLVADIPNQLIDNGRTKSFVFGGTQADFAQSGGRQDGVQDLGGQGDVVINGQSYKTSDFQNQTQVNVQPEPQSWADQMRSRYGQPIAGVAETPPPVPAAKAASWWKKK